MTSIIRQSLVPKKSFCILFHLKKKNFTLKKKIHKSFILRFCCFRFAKSVQGLLSDRMSIKNYFGFANEKVMKFKSPDADHYNHNSMAIGKFYIQPEKVGAELMKLIDANMLDMPLVPYASKNIKLFADIDNHKHGMFLFVLYIFYIFAFVYCLNILKKNKNKIQKYN